VSLNNWADRRTPDRPGLGVLASPDSLSPNSLYHVGLGGNSIVTPGIGEVNASGRVRGENVGKMFRIAIDQ
jgi:hypothetical protein